MYVSIYLYIYVLLISSVWLIDASPLQHSYAENFERGFCVGVFIRALDFQSQSFLTVLNYGNLLLNLFIF